MNVEQRAQLIRFGLETLLETNGHHRFEALCLSIARRRIASNLLPATGPVGAKGDQGRDAESYWTDLPGEGARSAFALLATREKVVLACSLQRMGVPAKIGHDIAAICNGGSRVNRVIYFTAAPIPIGRRHELQANTMREHGVDLDIWDVQAIALSLSEPDLLPSAMHHLDLPSEFAGAATSGKTLLSLACAGKLRAVAGASIALTMSVCIQGGWSTLRAAVESYSGVLGAGASTPDERGLSTAGEPFLDWCSSEDHASSTGYITSDADYAFKRRKEIRRPIGSDWGNPVTWAPYARAAGFNVDRTPQVGSVMAGGQGWRGLGEVAVVEDLLPGGSVVVSDIDPENCRIETRQVSALIVGVYNFIH